MQLVNLINKKDVFAAVDAAFSAGEDYALKALIAGQLLMEYREQLRVSHDEKPSINGRNQHSEGESFTKEIEAHYPKSVATVYRWIQAADRVSRAQLGLDLDAPFKPVIEIGDGKTISLSQALTLPEKQLPAQARNFRQGIFDFMADHTLGEAARAVFDGDSGAKRITLAAGGKKKGGKGSGDRKAFDVFAKTKLKHLTTFMGQKLTVNQKSQIVTAFDTAIEHWPRWIVEGLAEKCRTELKLTDHDRASRIKLEGGK